MKNVRAFTKTEKEMDEAISHGEIAHFAVVVCNVLGAAGKKATSEEIVDASHLICDTFRHSPVYRIDEAEFAVLVRDRDYKYREKILKVLQHGISEKIESGGAVIVSGVADFDSHLENTMENVFERACIAMKENERVIQK